MAVKRHRGSRTSPGWWRKPLFDDLLRGIRLRSGPYFRPEFRGPWGISVASGNARMAVEDALTEQDKAEGYILACEAKIHGDVTVDA